MKNKVTLLGYYGGDRTHALSAWQSTNIALDDFEHNKDINSRIQILYSETVKGKKRSTEDLLKMLASQSHHSPFEKSTLHFQISADIATHIHCLKHRIGISINSESARYKELENKRLIPDDWFDCDVENWDHPIFRIFNPDVESTWADVLDSYVKYGEILYHIACEQLTEKLGRKRAKESSRYFLTYAKQVDFDMMFNFRSFMHFQGLRNSSHAQKEVQEIAQMMLEQVRAIPDNPFEHSLDAFGY